MEVVTTITTMITRRWFMDLDGNGKRWKLLYDAIGWGGQLLR